jgi:hypothetical protein
VPSARIQGQQLAAVLGALMLGMLGCVVLLDIGAYASGVTLFALVGHWSMAIGILAGLVVLTVQLVDLVTTPVEGVGRRQLGMVSAITSALVVLFAVIWWVREDGNQAGNGALLTLEIVAFGAGLVGAWFFRELVAPPPSEPESSLWQPLVRTRPPSIQYRPGTYGTRR